MIKIVKEVLYEGYGAGFSQSSGFRGGMGGTTRGGFGGAWNAGGGNSMYTYEIKPLNHTLEPPNRYTRDDIETIKIGSKITGYPVKSNARPDNDIRITGIVFKIVRSHNGEIMYYEVQDEDTQKRVKIDPVSVDLNINPPVMSYSNTASQRSRRGEKIKSHLKEGLKVRETLY